MSASRGNLFVVSASIMALVLSGCGDDSTTRPKPSTTFRFADMDYIRGIYYFLYDPNLDLLQIQDLDIKVYLDDANYGNDQNAIPGRAFMDRGLTVGPTGVYGDPNISDTASVRGMFGLLKPGSDQDYEILQMYGSNFKVLRLTRQISGEQSLAVTYRAQRAGQGGTFDVGGQNALESDGVERHYMKLLRPPASRVLPGPSGFYSRDSLFALTRDLELKNFYQLPAQHVDPATFQLTVRQGVSEPPVTSILTQDGVSVPYLEVLGLPRPASNWHRHQSRIPRRNRTATMRQPAEARNSL